MKNLILATMALLSMTSVQAFAGASNVFIDCKSADGKAQLHGDVPGDFAEFDLDAKAQQPNGTLSISLYDRTNQQTGQTEKNGRVAVVDDVDNGVYTIFSEDSESTQQIKLYAIPRTLKVSRHSVNFHTSFTGKLILTSENGMTESTVSCVTNFQI